MTPEHLKYKEKHKTVFGAYGGYLIKDGQGGSVWQGTIQAGSEGASQVDTREREFQAEEQQVQSSKPYAEGWVINETDTIMAVLLELSFCRSGRH